jgi:hypothetical protein
MKSPSELDAQLSEFLDCPSEHAPRKLRLGVALNTERALLSQRLLANAMAACTTPERRAYWEKLYAVYQRIEQALYVRDPAMFRQIAAQVIFRGEEVPDVDTSPPAAGPGAA